MGFRKGATMKSIVFKINEDLYLEAKIKSLKEKKTFKDYIIGLIKADLSKEKDAQS